MTSILEPDELITRCIKALGGRESLFNVVTIHIEISRTISQPAQPSITRSVDVYRARGGLIRQEEYLDDRHRRVTILNGLRGIEREESLINKDFQADRERDLRVDEIAEIKRNVRLYPRNFLAHADEHQYRFSGLQKADNGDYYLLELPIEEVDFHFDSNSLLCLRRQDHQKKKVIHYQNYQEINGVFTPLIERTEAADELVSIDEIRKLEYNLPLSNGFFAVD